jgi:predicted TIM-barrel fold metal-dependent hydrolase
MGRSGQLAEELALASRHSPEAAALSRWRRSLILEFHTHVVPPKLAADPFWQGRCPMTIENVLEAAKVAGVDKSVISNPGQEMRDMDTAQQLATVELINRHLAFLAEKHENISAMATTNPYGGEKFLRELERAVRQEGCKGVIILSSLRDQYPDDDEAIPLCVPKTSSALIW